MRSGAIRFAEATPSCAPDSTGRRSTAMARTQRVSERCRPARPRQWSRGWSRNAMTARTSASASPCWMPPPSPRPGPAPRISRGRCRCEGPTDLRRDALELATEAPDTLPARATARSGGRQQRKTLQPACPRAGKGKAAVLHNLPINRPADHTTKTETVAAAQSPHPRP